MANSLIQFRYEESNRQKASSICEQLGMDLATYLRMALNRLIQENGIPFPMKLEQAPEENKGLEAMKAASRIAEESDISEMSLDEINYEISQARNKEIYELSYILHYIFKITSKRWSLSSTVMLERPLLSLVYGSMLNCMELIFSNPFSRYSNLPHD